MQNSSGKFQDIGFADFKKMAADDELSIHEKIGFPDDYRANQEDAIYTDITSKCLQLHDTHRRVLDIGAGCGLLAHRFIENCQNNKHQLTLIDCEEMLNLLPEGQDLNKISGHFPSTLENWIKNNLKSFDVILCYSVLHYIFQDDNLFNFFDQVLSLLADGGELLLGDIPNHSMRQRFFASSNGIKFHQEFMKTQEAPIIDTYQLIPNKIDDSVLMSLMLRARNQGFHAYLVPQNPKLPMANRREDLLVRKP